MKTRALVSVAGYLSLLWTFSLAVAPRAAVAQQWHGIYGENSTRQFGEKGVTPVLGSCEGGNGGYIAVGTSVDAQYPLGVDVYVIRTDNSGATLWEQTYDVRGVGDDDYGTSIIELSDGSGFIVTGTTYQSVGSGSDAFLMKINCSGIVVWTKTYAGPTYVTGQEVIETTTGTGTTAPGDLVVAGWSTDASGGGEDALLFRTNSGGGIIWSRRYATNSVRSNEHLLTLTEATATPGGSVGDIIAAGTMISDTDPSAADHNGLILRVGGGSGLISTIFNSQHGAAEYGFGSMFLHSADIFHSIIELQNPSETGTAGVPNVVVVGHGTNVISLGPPPIVDPGGVSIYLVKLNNGSPCSPTIQAYVGLDGSHDEGHDIVEVPFSTYPWEGIQQYDLVVTGWTNGLSNNATADALMLGIDPTTLGPTGTGMAYRPGFVAEYNDRGASLNMVQTSQGRTRGAILCGLTESDWLADGDPQDIYLVKTDMSLSAGDCEESYDPIKRERDSDHCLSVTVSSNLTESNVYPARQPRNWDAEVCTSRLNGRGKEVPTMRTEPSIGYETQTTPNPVRSGEGVVLRLFGDGVPEQVDLSITNALGETIRSEEAVSIEGDGMLRLETGSWTPGVYFISVADKSYRRVLRVVVSD